MCSRYASMTSTHETWRLATARESSVASHETISRTAYRTTSPRSTTRRGVRQHAHVGARVAA